MRDYLDRRVAPPKLVTSPTWGPPPSCKQALSFQMKQLVMETCDEAFFFFFNKREEGSSVRRLLVMVEQGVHS